MKPQMGFIGVEQPPFWLVKNWMFFMSVLMLCFAPSTSFVWDLVYGLLFICIFTMSACVYTSIVTMIWRMFYTKRRNVYEEQLGIRLPSFVTPDFVARETTLLLALKTSIVSSSDKSGVIAALVSYAQAHSQRSLLGHLMSFMRSESDRNWYELVSGHINTMIEQDGEDEEKWLNDLKEALTNWTRYRENKDIKNFLKLLNYVVSVGMCEASSLTFKMGRLTFFAPVVYKNQINCVDLMDLVCTTAIGFIEGGWRVYKTGEVSAFFAHDEDMKIFEEKYNRIRDIHGYSLTGNLKEHANIAETDYEVLLDEIIALGDKVAKKISRTMTVEKKFVMDRLDRLRDWRNEFTQVRTRGGLRKSPFAVSLYGNTGVGKSTLNQLTYEAIGRYNEIDVSDERVAVWADNDKYASNIRSSTNVIIFDDLGNTTPKFMDFSPVYRLIQTINNALFLAPMAEAFLKGKVALHPWIVMITTNVEHLLAEQYSEKPESVLRRMFHVKVEVREEFQTDGRLDSRKVKEIYGMKRDADIWLLTVRRCVVGAPKTTNSDKNHYELQPITFEGEEMYKVDVYTYLRWAQVASKDHFDFQAELIELNTVKKDDDKCCTKCGFAFCDCEKIEMAEQCARLPSEVDLNVHPDDDSVVGELNELCHGLRTMLGVDDCFEENASPLLRSILRRLLWYFAGYCFGFILQVFIIILQLPSESRVQFIRYYTAWARNYLIAWRNSLRRSVMWNLYRFARWQLQQRWNIRAFFWRLKETRTEDLIHLENWYNDSIFDWVAWVPESFITSPLVTYGVLFARRYEIIDKKWKVLLLYWWCLTACGWWLVKGWFFSSLLLFYTTVTSIAVVLYYEKRAIQHELLQRNSALPAYVKIFKEHSGKLLLGTGLFGLYHVCRWIYGMKKVFAPQGNLLPTSMKDIEERDAEPNVWAANYISPLPMSTASKTTTSHDLANLCCENLVYVESAKYFIRGFFIESNFMILPAHFVKKHWEEGHLDFDVRCWRRNPKVTGGNFRDKIAKEYTYVVPGTDFVICWTPSAGSMGDMRKFLPMDAVSDSEATFILKEKSGDIEFAKTFYRHDRTGIDHYSMKHIPGGTYKLPFDTADGMCMSPLVSRGKGTTILGFHLCGQGRTGGCGYLTYDQVEKGLKYLAEVPGIVRTASRGTLPKDQFGKKLVEDGEIHRKSATRFLTEGCSIEIYGPTSGRATPVSSVVPTIISDLVAEVTGVPQKWGPPKLKGEGVYPYQVALEQLSHPSLSLGSIVVKAVRCYRMQFLKIREKLPELFKECKPLTQVQTVSGIIGKRFIDPMNFNTSPGWPLSGKKTKLLIDLDPDEYPGHADPKTFKEEYMEDWRQARQVYLRGLRYYPVFKAATKDEPTKLSKKKVRVFQCAPLTLQCIIRQYFLPIASCMSNHPVTSECAVGINSQGPQWNKLMKHLSRFGQERIVAGDFKAYDQHMSATMTMWAFSIMIELAKHADYSDDDIKIMESVVADVIHPVMCVNGDLVELLGSNPSGQNLTVYINSIVNSLYQRCVFYTLYPIGSLKSNRFSDYVALMTYGDDNEMGVSPEVPRYNHTEMQKIYNGQGIEYTMADKDAESVPFIHLRDADFLKRATEFREEYSDPTTGEKGMFLAKLSEDSIFKSLHCNMASKHTTREAIARQCLDGAMRELWFHGREHFDMRHEQLKAVVADHKWEHLVAPSFYKTFDEREVEWLDKYNLVKASSQSGLLPYKYDQKEEPSSDESAIIDAWVAKAEKAGIVIRAREYSLDGEVYGDIIAQYGQEVWCVEFKAKGGLNAAMEQAHRQRTILRSVMKQKSWLGVAIVRAVAYTHNEYRVDSTVSKPMKKLFKSLL
jgi:hypothetical protein